MSTNSSSSLNLAVTHSEYSSRAQRQEWSRQLGVPVLDEYSLRGSDPHRARDAERPLPRLRGHRAPRRARSRHHAAADPRPVRHRRDHQPAQRGDAVHPLRAGRLHHPAGQSGALRRSTGRRSPASTAGSTTPSSTATAARSPPAASSMRPIAGCSTATCIWRSSRSCSAASTWSRRASCSAAITPETRLHGSIAHLEDLLAALPGASGAGARPQVLDAFPPKIGKRRRSVARWRERRLNAEQGRQ